MITRTATRWQTTDWQSELKNANFTLGELCERLNLDLDELAVDAEKEFSIRVPPGFLANIRPNDPNDPLLLQVLPRAEETRDVLFMDDDPLDEKLFNPVPGLLHKYHGRVLLISNPACAIHCRYCFRRHFPYSENSPPQKDWQAAMDYINQDSSIEEVILSGGDPLASNDRLLHALFERLQAIGHIRTVRIHTRIPTCLPSRVTDDLLKVMTHFRFKVLVVLHINHVNELGADARHAIHLLQSRGIRLLNQGVLLKDINDSVNAQQDLLDALHELDIQAYYLHLPDKVRGTSHFDVPEDKARDIYQLLMQKNPGYKLPKLVRETPHELHKSPVKLIES